MRHLDPFASIQAATRSHRKLHGCGAYTFEDGPGLARVAAASGATRILELGTALGYTACCLASGAPGAIVDTVEGDPAHVELAKELIAKAGLTERIRVHIGEFDQVLGKLPEDYDLAFFDGFAPSDAILALLRNCLTTGGILVCANLGLVEGVVQARLLQDFKNAERWLEVCKLESGRTIVLRKVSREGKAP